MQTLANVIIRPDREAYQHSDLGPEMFLLKGTVYRRRDIELVNEQGYVLKCSWYLHEANTGRMPCVVYCHGNCGNRLESFDAVENLLPMGISVFSFDFAGSGLSEGSYISLGYYESMDVKTIVDFLRLTQMVSTISLWGRSMGAVSIIRYAAQDKSIASLVVDSPFSTLQELCRDIAGSYKILPNAFTSYILEKVRKKIRKVAKFDINDLNPVDSAPLCTASAMFVHCTKDELVQIGHMRRIYEAYGGDKSKVEIEGGHNTPRPVWVYERACQHIKRQLRPPLQNLFSSMPSRVSPMKYVQKELSSDSELEDMDLEDIDEFYEGPGAETARAAFPSLTQEIRDRVDVLSKHPKREFNGQAPEARTGLQNIPYSSLQRTRFGERSQPRPPRRI